MYGTVDGVASLVPRYCNTSGTFDSTTRPTLSQVNAFLQEVSGLLDLILAAEGFSVPITLPSVQQVLGMFVEMEVASIVEGINGSGRFGPTEKGPQKSRFSLISQDVRDFLSEMAIGFEKLGASRPLPPSSGIGFRSTSESGSPTFPIFQRDDYGKDSFFTDEDPAS